MTKTLNKRPYGLSREQYVEYAICDLQKANKKHHAFYKGYHVYLATQRQLLIEEIIESLRKVGVNREKGVFYRVISSKYMDDPLCTAGSLLHSGRFNFGNISYDYKSFPCLYVSSNEEGAKHEKFPNKKMKLLSSSEMSLIPDDSFLTSRCEVNLTKCINVRTQNSLKYFTKIISQIDPTERFQKKWKKMNRNILGKTKVKPLKTIKGIKELYQSLFEIYYEQWVSWLDIPSNSQWFGHYVKEAGIEAIIYPSLRYEGCYNLAVFPQNFKSKSYVRLIDFHKSVSEERTEIRKTNHRFFEHPFESYSAQ